MRKLATGCAATIIVTPVLVAVAFMAMQPELFAAVVWRMFWTFIALCGLVIVVLIVTLHNRSERRERQMVDGAFLLRVERSREWNLSLPWPLALFEYIKGYKSYHDPNRVEGHTWAVRNGVVFEQTPAAGWALQHEYNLAIEGTNKVRAAFPGQESNNNPWGRDAQVPRFPSARVLQPKLAKPVESAGLIEMDNDAPTREPLPDVGTALAIYRGPTVYLGQNDEDVALWNPRTDPHLGVWGKTGSGKTTRIGLTVALAQIVQGYRVIVIDPDLEAGKSVWRSLSPWAQVITPGTFGCDLWPQIMQWYEARWATLEKRGVSENYQLERPLTPLAIHFEEFARWRDRCKKRGGDDRKYYEQTVECLSEIAQRGRKPGCHLAIYGQLPGELPEAIDGNLVGVTLKQNANQGNKVGHWGAHQLHEGQFAYEGSVYESFQPVQDVARLLAGRTPRDYIVGPDACVRGGVREDGVSILVENSPVRERTNATNAANGGGKWEEFTRDWLQNNQPSPSALARAMAAAEGDVKPYERYKGVAAQMIAKCNPPPPPTALDQLRAMGIDPTSVALPGGGRLGVDVSYAVGGD